MRDEMPSTILPALVLLTAVGAVFRMVNLGDKSFWIDELITLCHSQAIVDARTLFTPTCGDMHPPLYFLLVKLWSIGGTGEAYLRAMSALAGVAAIPAVYAVARTISGPRVAIVAAGLTAVSPFMLLQDRELRMYSLFVLMSMASIVFFTRAVTGGRRQDWVLFTVLSIVNVYVHYHAMLLLAGQAVLWLWWYRRGDVVGVRPALISAGAIVTAFAFWVPGLLFQLRNPALFTLDAPDKFPVASADGLARVGYVFYAFGLGQTLLPWRAAAVVGGVALLALTLAGIRQVWARPETRMRLLALFAVPLALGFVVSQSMPRYYVFLAPLFYLVVAEGWFAVRNARLRMMLAGAMLVALGISVSNYYRGADFHVLAPADPWREVGAYLGERARPGDCLVTIGSFAPLGYYTNGFEPFRRPVFNNAFIPAEECLRDTSRRVWIVTADPAMASTAADAVQRFDTRYQRVAERRFLRDPDFTMKSRLFRKAFLEYRISVYGYERPVSPARAEEQG